MNCGKVPLPVARSTPFGGARAAGTGKLWSVCINHLRGAQQARSAPGRQGAAAGCALYALLGRAGGWHRQAMVGLHKPFTRRTTKAAMSMYAAHNKRGQRRERM